MSKVQLAPAVSPDEKALMMEIAKFNTMMETAFTECAPHKVCAYIYDLANALTVSITKPELSLRRMRRKRPA